MEKICGIYKITNKINGKMYIGQSVDIYDRWIKEKAPSAQKYALQRAFDKYGRENFNFEIIERLKPDKLNEREIYWIAYYDTYNNGYNETLGGDTGHRYNYKEIYDLWASGVTCKQIEEKLHCDDGVITRALRCYDISEQEARSVNNYNKATPIVMIDIKTKESLKVFRSRFEVCSFLNITEAQTNSIQKGISTKRKAFGYYWEKLTKENSPKIIYTDEEVLSRQDFSFMRSKENTLKLSMAQRTVERPDRNTLKQLIRTIPFTTIGKMYGNVSDNAVRKWCDFEGLPRKKNVINSYSDKEWEKI